MRATSIYFYSASPPLVVSIPYDVGVFAHNPGRCSRSCTGQFKNRVDCCLKGLSTRSIDVVIVRCYVVRIIYTFRCSLK